MAPTSPDLPEIPSDQLFDRWPRAFPSQKCAIALSAIMALDGGLS
jgi:hypothetical protein